MKGPSLTETMLLPLCSLICINEGGEIQASKEHATRMVFFLAGSSQCWNSCHANAAPSSPSPTRQNFVHNITYINQQYFKA